MKIRTIAVAMSLALTAGTHASAQLLHQGEGHTDEHHSCRVVDDGTMRRLRQRLGLEDAFRGLPSRSEDLNKTPYFADDRTTYVFRVAIGITAEGFERELQSNEAKIPQYLNELEESLNKFYERDCGIRMQLVRDSKLYLWKNSEVPRRPAYHQGTDLINNAIGTENYDLGILMTGNSGGLQGLGTLGGVQNPTTKANGIAISDHTTMAHELGHLLGAEHTHDNTENSIQIEPGNGRSIMSYGMSVGRTFFALSSARVMRISCAALKHYNKERTQAIKNHDIADANSVVALPFEGRKPKLKKEKLKPDYKITSGTYYQFNIDVEEHHDGFRYNAHLIDRVKTGRSNSMQPFYESFTYPQVMHHPRYSTAYYTKASNYREYGEVLVDYSDQYREGTFTYALSASNQGQHDSYVTRLHIVPGPRFGIKTIQSQDKARLDKAIAGTPLTITWEPCHQLYKEHKVRILLSDDFGQTFKYVLADNVPNNGSWTGAFPYLTINKTDYPSYTNSARNNPIKGIRAGVIKIEVIDELAYDLSHIKPYIVQGTQQISTGGFTLEIDANKSLVFKRENGTAAPAQTLIINNRSELETAPRLVAHLGSQSITTEATEETVGNVVTRKWTATIGSVTSTYTQVVQIKGEEVVEPDHRREAKALYDLAKELNNRIGSLGYPRADLPLSHQLRKLFPAIFTEDGQLHSSASDAQIKEFLAVLKKFEDLNDRDIVMPISGVKYYLVSYHRTFTGERRYYIKAQPNDYWTKEKPTPHKSEATQWSHQEVDGTHHFTFGTHKLHLDQTHEHKKGMRLVRGATWGAFSIIGQDDTPRIAQVDTDGKTISYNDNYILSPNEYRTNKPGNTISTDFQLEVVDEDFDIFFETKTWNNLNAQFADEQSANRVLTPQREQNGRYRIAIPSGYGTKRVRFSDGNGKSMEVALTGRSETYSELGGRSHKLTVTASRYSTLYLDYAVSIPQGVKAFTATLVGRADNPTYGPNSYDLSLSPLLVAIPARTPVIIYGESAQTYEFVEDFGAIPSVAANDLVGVVQEVAPTSREEDYHYFDLTKPSGTPTAEGTRLTFPKLDAQSVIPANSAYLVVYKYTNNNYNINEIALATDELKKEAEQPKDDPKDKPEDTPAPTPNPSNPEDGTGDSKPDDSQDKDNQPDDNGSNTGEPNQPDATAGERGTLDHPYSARGLERHSVQPSPSALWVRGKFIGYLDEQGRLTDRATGIIALGSDDQTFIPVFIPESLRPALERIKEQELFVLGSLSHYLRGLGISPQGFERLRTESGEIVGIEVINTTPISPYEWTGDIYDLSGVRVSRGGFSDLPAGVYILNGGKYIKP